MNTQQFHSDVLILGAGIGGYETFRELNKLFKKRNIKKKITIIDQNNFFTFTPLLHEVASGAVEPSHTAIPLRELLHGTPHDFFKARIHQIMPNHKTVETNRGTFSYDYCIVALGSGVNYFGTPGADKHTFNVRTLREAMRLREAMIRRLENDHTDLIVSVIGGGYTGVEVASQFAYFLQHDVKELYPNDTTSVHIIESSAELVATLPPRARVKLLKQLAKLKVNINLNSRVKEVKENSLVFQDGSEKTSHITIWTAGIGNFANQFLPESMCEKGRMVLNECLQGSTPGLYGVGDVVMAKNRNETYPHPQLGEAAHRHGTYVAKHIVASLENKQLPVFHFKSAGTFMPVGEKYGIVISGGFVFSGLFAWWIRRTAYIMFIPGFRRKLQIAFDWTLKLFGFSYIIELEK
jgi:NADH dehydrogenase